MDRHKGPLAKLSQFVHKRFLWLMIGSYAVASGFPAARPLDPRCSSG